MRRLPIILACLAGSGCALTNTASQPTGSPAVAHSGGGIDPGASAGASIGGGPLGTGTDDNRAGAR